MGIDGPFTANDPECRAYALERAKRCVDIANALGTRLIVLWLAREGTYIRESKNAIDSHKHLVEALNQFLNYDGQVEIAIEPKPNEPMDQAFIPTIGHALAIAADRREVALENDLGLGTLDEDIEISNGIFNQNPGILLVKLGQRVALAQQVQRFLDERQRLLAHLFHRGKGGLRTGHVLFIEFGPQELTA